jgi:hypothetical protein
VWKAVRKVIDNKGYYPTHLGGCIGMLSSPECDCGITDLHFAVRAYDKLLTEMAQAMSER